MRHMNALLRVMSNPQCEVFPQIKLILISSKLVVVIVSKFQRENLCHARLALRTLEKYHQERLWHRIHQHHQSQNILRREYSILFLT